MQAEVRFEGATTNTSHTPTPQAAEDFENSLSTSTGLPVGPMPGDPDDSPDPSGDTHSSDPLRIELNHTGMKKLAAETLKDLQQFDKWLTNIQEHPEELDKAALRRWGRGISLATLNVFLCGMCLGYGAVVPSFLGAQAGAVLGIFFLYAAVRSALRCRMPENEKIARRILEDKEETASAG